MKQEYKIESEYEYIKKVIYNKKNKGVHLESIKNMITNFIEKYDKWIYAECLSILLNGDITIMKSQNNIK